jgi:DNA (cytosine-5)-methyltransferase 1
MNLRSLRQAKGLSQAKLAELLNVNRAKLSAIELGKKEPELQFVQQAVSLLSSITDSEINALKKKRVRHAGTVKRTKSVECIEYLPEQPVRDIPETPTAISLFSGCGGMCLGFENAGFRILGNVEIDPELRDIYTLNFPHVPLLGADITEIGNEEIKNWNNLASSIDLIFGGPPCQGFSLAGKRNVNDPRNMLFMHMIRIASLLRPKYVVMENVRLLTSMKAPDGSYVHSHVTAAFKNIGYQIEFAELNAMDYGVPQFRERVIFIAVRNDVRKPDPLFPSATHGKSASESSLFTLQLKHYLTFYDATNDLESLEPGQHSTKDPLHFAVAHPPHVVEWLRHTPEGCSAHDNPDPEHRPPSGYNTTYKRIRWNEPSSTIQTTFGMISACRTVHPTDHRSLTIREAMRCQTFPDHFRVRGKIGTIRTAIGNALPPSFAEAIAKHIKQQGNFETRLY